MTKQSCKTSPACKQSGRSLPGGSSQAGRTMATRCKDEKRKRQQAGCGTSAAGKASASKKAASAKGKAKAARAGTKSKAGSGGKSTPKSGGVSTSAKTLQTRAQDKYVYLEVKVPRSQLRKA